MICVLRLTARRAGSAILVAALATAAGFLAFVPTAFSGVAELGLIAGAGMLIAFLCTMAFLPAAITLCNPRDESAEVGFSWGRSADMLLAHWALADSGGVCGIGCAGTRTSPTSLVRF
jgi:uncharacterized protein